MCAEVCVCHFAVAGCHEHVIYIKVNTVDWSDGAAPNLHLEAAK